MKPRLNCFAIGLLLATFMYAAEADNPSVDVDHDPVAAELNQLGLEYERLAAEQRRAVPADGAVKSDGQLPDEAWLEQGRARDAKAPNPDSELLPRLLAFAKAHSDSPFALDALFFVIHRGGAQTGDVHGKPWQIKEQALNVAEAHIADPRFFVVLESLGGSLPSQKTESFLRQVVQNGPDRTLQAAAAFNLARYYDTLCGAYKRSQELKHKPQLINFERFWKLVVTPYLEQNFPLDEEKNSAEVERLLNEVIEKYGDVPVTDWSLSGPGNIFLHAVPFRQPKTYGELAKSMLFELNSIVPGKQAPDIEGTDADGKRFRLSDYRGKVVLLTFSADWCGSCVNLYPLERKLVEEFGDQPFVMLSVSRDEKIDTLKSAIESGEITWRCWWDGIDGPIARTWNARYIPHIILLDHQHVFQNVNFFRFSSQEEFEREITALLRKVPAESGPAMDR